MRLVVATTAALRPAVQDLEALLARVDAAASRFRPDSALSRANARAGRPVPIPRLLVDLVDAALDAAAATAPGRSTPHSASRCSASVTTATSLPSAATPAPPAPRRRVHGRAAADRTGVDRPGWRAVRLHREAGLLTVPRGTALDLGATAKAWTADHAASTLAARYGTAVLVELGGDLAVAGDTPAAGASGWPSARARTGRSCSCATAAWRPRPPPCAPGAAAGR